jgi:hypothetical protein
MTFPIKIGAAFRNLLMCLPADFVILDCGGSQENWQKLMNVFKEAATKPFFS